MSPSITHPAFLLTRQSADALLARGPIHTPSFEPGLCDALSRLSQNTSEQRYLQAWREYAARALAPGSGIVWGERGVAGVRVSWEALHAIDPQAVERELQEIFFQDAAKQGDSIDPALAGTYIEAWTWLHAKTGEGKLLRWADQLDQLFWNAGRAKQGTQADGCGFFSLATSLLFASQWLDDAGQTFRAHGVDYLRILTQRPTSHAPAIAIGFAITGSPDLCEAFDAAVSELRLSARLSAAEPMAPDEAASLILALLHVAQRSEDEQYVTLAGDVVEHALARQGRAGGPNLDAFCDLSSALLAYAQVSDRGIERVELPTITRVR